MKLIKLIIIFLFISITSCELAKPAIPVEPYRFHKDFTDNGLIVGSITFPKEKALFNSYYMYFKNLDPDPKKAIKNSEQLYIYPESLWKLKHNGQLDNGLTYLFMLEVAVGNYEISQLNLHNNHGMINTVSSLDNTFSIPFSVNQGEIKYVGNLMFNEYATENDTLINYANHYERDIEAMKKIIPTVNWANAVNDTTIKLRHLKNIEKK